MREGMRMSVLYFWVAEAQVAEVLVFVFSAMSRASGSSVF